MKKIPFSIFLAILLFGISGCNLDKLDFSKLSSELNLNPEIVAPIARANISVLDLIKTANNEDLISTDPNGLLIIKYSQKDIYNYKVRDFLSIPDQQKFNLDGNTLGEISFDDILISRKISLNDCVKSFNGELNFIIPYDGKNTVFPQFSYAGAAVQFDLNSISDFKSVTISTGTLEIAMQNKLKIPVKIAGNLFDTVNKRKIADFDLGTIQPDQIGKTTISLSGIEISNLAELRLVTFETPGSAAPILINLEDYFDLAFNLRNLSVSKGNLIVEPQTLASVTDAFNMFFPEPDFKAFKAVLKSGILTIKTINTTKLTGSISLVLPEIKKNGVAIKVNIPLNGITTTLDLSGVDMNFSSIAGHPYNRIPFSYSIEINKSNGYIDYVSTDLIKMEVALTNLDYKSIHGDFGVRQIVVDYGEFDMNIDVLDKIGGGFKLINPKVELVLRNSIGMPAKVNMNFNAYDNSGNTVALNPPVIDIPVPANISAGFVTKSFVFDKLNSNVVNFMALPPSDKISYSGLVSFNPSQTVTAQNPNFLDLEKAIFALDMNLEIPLELQIKNLEIRDTTAISKGEYDNLESIDLILNAKNGIPLDIDMQLFFVDTISNKQFGSSKKTKILAAAQVDEAGKITPVQSSQTLSLDAAEMSNLRKANGIVFTGSLSSPSGGTKTATLYSASKLELSVVIKSKINL